MKHKVLLAVSAIIVFVVGIIGCGDFFGGEPPVGATVRYGILSDSVLQLYNSSHNRVKIQVTFTGKNGDSVCKSFEIDPISQIEIGALEAPWNFEAGETARVHVDGYRKDLFIKISADGKQYGTEYK